MQVSEFAKKNGLNKLFFEAINRVMVAIGHTMKGRTVVDATSISAPGSTKNAEKARDPEMHQMKKGNEWHFGRKSYIGADASSGLVHTMEVPAIKVHDVTVAARLIWADDEVIYDDSGYLAYSKATRGFEKCTAVCHRLPHSPPPRQPAQDV